LGVAIESGSATGEMPKKSTPLLFLESAVTL